MLQFVMLWDDKQHGRSGAEIVRYSDTSYVCSVLHLSW